MLLNQYQCQFIRNHLVCKAVAIGFYILFSSFENREDTKASSILCAYGKAPTFLYSIMYLILKTIFLDIIGYPRITLGVKGDYFIETNDIT